ncbi:MAG: hypothetical protein ACFCU7_02575 [Pleurocapsa sp.]
MVKATQLDLDYGLKWRSLNSFYLVSAVGRRFIYFENRQTED